MNITEIQTRQRVGAFPLLLVGRLDVVHDQRHPAAEDEHPVADQRAAVQRTRQRCNAVGDGSCPDH